MYSFHFKALKCTS